MFDKTLMVNYLSFNFVSLESSLPMRVLATLFIIFLFRLSIFGQLPDSCLLVGAYALEKVEMSQSIDSNSRSVPNLRWSLYEQSGLADSLTIGEDFAFTRSINFLQHFDEVLSGQFSVKQDSQFTVFVSKGSLYTLPTLNIDVLDSSQLVIIEKFKTRWMRRTFVKKR